MPISITLATTYDDLVRSEVHVLDPELKTLQ
jgi:hypothetical protein